MRAKVFEEFLSEKRKGSYTYSDSCVKKKKKNRLGGWKNTPISLIIYQYLWRTLVTYREMGVKLIC